MTRYLFDDWLYADGLPLPLKKLYHEDENGKCIIPEGRVLTLTRGLVAWRPPGIVRVELDPEYIPTEGLAAGTCVQLVDVSALGQGNVGWVAGVQVVDPEGASTPWVDGVLLADVAQDARGYIAIGQGYEYELEFDSGMGPDLYVDANGMLTDESPIDAALTWHVHVGRVTAGGRFIFDPHPPVQLL